MINLADNELLLRCSCNSHEHIAFLIHEPDDSRGNNLKGEHDDWYLSVMLDHFPFWKRLRKGLQYIFRPGSIRYGMTAELVLRSEDMDRIAKFIGARCQPDEQEATRRIAAGLSRPMKFPEPPPPPPSDDGGVTVHGGGFRFDNATIAGWRLLGAFAVGFVIGLMVGKYLL